MFAHARAITSTDLFQTLAVLGLVGDIDHQPRDLFRPSPNFGDDGDYVSKSAIKLVHKIRADDLLLMIPGDLSGDKQQTAAFRQYTVRITMRRAQGIRVDNFQSHLVLSLPVPRLVEAKCL